jgi:hypothetical protein
VREDAFPGSSGAGWQLVAAEGFALLYVVVCEALDGGDLQVWGSGRHMVLRGDVAISWARASSIAAAVGFDCFSVEARHSMYCDT